MSRLRLRQREHRACCTVEVDELVLDFLVRTGWLAEADAADAQAIGRAVTAMLRRSSEL
jgi:hypothetical protein